MTLQDLTAAFAHEYAACSTPTRRPTGKLVLVATLLHDTGWTHVDEERIISEGFRGDWRKSAIRFEHEHQGCEVAKRVLPGVGYSEEFIAKVTAIIDGHDTRQEAHSIKDALMRDADRSWRFDRVGIALASGWLLNHDAVGTPRWFSTARKALRIVDFPTPRPRGTGPVLAKS